MSRRLIWLSIALVAATTAILTFASLAGYPLLVERAGRDGPFSIPLLLALLALFATAPFVLPVAIIWPRAATVAAAEIHAALYAALIAVLSATSSPSHGSPADALGALIWLVVYAILAAEIALLLLAVFRLWRSKPAFARLPWLFAGLLAAILGGWAIGVAAWSETVPAKVVAAAEAVAGDKPYCLLVVGHPATGRADLTGLAMRARNDGGWVWAFHAVLVIDGEPRAYRNWSYRSGRFEPVTDGAREGLHLDRAADCDPRPHRARGWVAG